MTNKSRYSLCLILFGFFVTLGIAFATMSGSNSSGSEDTISSSVVESGAEQKSGTMGHLGISTESGGVDIGPTASSPETTKQETGDQISNKKNTSNIETDENTEKKNKNQIKNNTTKTGTQKQTPQNVYFDASQKVNVQDISQNTTYLFSVSSPILSPQSRFSPTNLPNASSNIPFPQQVVLTFTKLPKGNRSVLFQKEDLVVGGKAEQAYTFETKGFTNGTFEYTMKLPNPYGDEAQVLRREDDNDAFKKIPDPIVHPDGTISFVADHFTTFVVTWSGNPTPDGTGCVLLGASTSGDCFLSLQDAVNAAIGNEDEIRVYSGSYTGFTVPVGGATDYFLDIVAMDPNIKISGDVIINSNRITLDGFDRIQGNLDINGDEFTGSTLGPIEGNVLVDADRVLLQNIGNIDGDILVQGNGFRATNLSDIGGDVEVHGNNAYIFSGTIGGGMLIDGNNGTFIDLKVDGYGTHTVGGETAQGAVVVFGDTNTLQQFDLLNGGIGKPIGINHSQGIELTLESSELQGWESAIVLEGNITDTIYNNLLQSNGTGIAIKTDAEQLTTLSIANNSFLFNDTAILQTDSTAQLHNIDIYRNIFEDNNIAVDLENIQGDSQIFQNEFTGNTTFAVRNRRHGDAIDANYNRWGIMSGDATTSGPDPLGSGDRINNTGRVLVNKFARYKDLSANEIDVGYLDQSHKWNTPNIDSDLIDVTTSYEYEYSPPHTRTYIDGTTGFMFQFPFTARNPGDCSYTFNGGSIGALQPSVGNTCVFNGVDRFQNTSETKDPNLHIEVQVKNYFGFEGDGETDVVVDRDDPDMTQNPLVQYTHNSSLYPGVSYTGKIFTNQNPRLSVEDAEFASRDTTAPLRSCAYNLSGSIGTANTGGTSAEDLCRQSFTAQASGDYIMQFSGTDRVGHVGTRGVQIPYTVDDTNPNISFLNIATGTRTHPVHHGTIASLVQDDTRVDQARYSMQATGVDCTGLNDTDFTSFSNRTTPTPSYTSNTLRRSDVYDKQKICVRGYDLVQNVANTEYGPFYIDQTAPVITITPLLTNKNCSSSDGCPRITGTIADNYGADYVDNITITVDGVNYSGVNNNDGTWYADIGTVPNLIASGVYAVTASATDRAGNTTSITDTNGLLIDTEAIVMLSLPVHDIYLTTGINVAFQAKCLADPAGFCDRMRFHRDGSDGGTTSNGGDIVASIPGGLSSALQYYTLATEGTYHARVRGRDSAGNESDTQAQSHRVIVDRTAPSIALAGITAVTTTGDTVSVTITEEYLDHYQYAVVTSGTDCTTVTTYTTGTIVSTGAVSVGEVEITNDDADGMHLCVQATDKAGNIGYEYSTDAFMLDTTVPTVSVSSDTSTYCNDKNIIFTITASDTNGLHATPYRYEGGTWTTSTTHTTTNDPTIVIEVRDSLGNVSNRTYTASLPSCGGGGSGGSGGSGGGGSSGGGSSGGGSSNGGGGGGGGGSVTLKKDDCPDGDFTSSYYDNKCGTPSVEIITKPPSPTTTTTYQGLVEIIEKYETKQSLCTSVFPQFQYVQFTDTQGHQYENPAYDLLSQCAVWGIGNDGTKRHVPFGINRKVTRAEVIKMLVNTTLIAQGKNILIDQSPLTTSINDYSDVSPQARYAPYIAQAKQRGWLPLWEQQKDNNVYLLPYTLASMKETVDMVKQAAQYLGKDPQQIPYYQTNSLTRGEFATLITEIFAIQGDYFFTSNASNNLLFLKSIAQKVENMENSQQLPFLKNIYLVFATLSSNKLQQAKLDRRSILKVLDELIVKVGGESEWEQTSLRLSTTTTPPTSNVSLGNTTSQDATTQGKSQKTQKKNTSLQQEYTTNIIQNNTITSPQIQKNNTIIPKEEKSVLENVQTSLQKYKQAAQEIEQEKAHIQQQIKKHQSTLLELAKYQKLFTEEGKDGLVKEVKQDIQRITKEIERLQDEL